MSEWQPIETAPKDGTPILIWSPTEHLRSTIIACWEGLETVEYAAFMDEQGDSYFHPTHWMPLPEPPRPTQGEPTQ